MNFDEIEYEQKWIEKYIKQYSTKKPIIDGIIDVEKYINSKFKICFVLKEPGGSIKNNNLCKAFLSNSEEKKLWYSQTWTPLHYISFSILNNFDTFEKIHNERNRNELIQSFLCTSFFNVGKEVGESSTPPTKLKKLYNEWRPILHWQLNKYNPQIIIFCGTWDLFWKDLGIIEKDNKYLKDVHYILKNNKIFLDVYHPAQREIYNSEYVNGIINVIKKNIDKIT